MDTGREGSRVREGQEGDEADLRLPPHVRDDEPRGGVSLFSLSRRMGTSLDMIDRT